MQGPLSPLITGSDQENTTGFPKPQAIDNNNKVQGSFREQMLQEHLLAAITTEP